MFYITAIVKAILIFVLILLIMRIIGKAGFGRLSPNDATLVLVVAAVIGMPLIRPEQPITYTLLIVGTAVILQFIFARLSLVDKLRPWLESSPTVIIVDGKISYKNMKDNHFDMDQLLSALRLSGIRNINEVELGTLEPCGRFSVMKKQNSDHAETGEDSTFIHLKKDAIRQFEKQGLQMTGRKDPTGQDPLT